MIPRIQRPQQRPALRRAGRSGLDPQTAGSLGVTPRWGFAIAPPVPAARGVTIQGLGANVQQLLGGVPEGGRRSWIERLSPYARLVYLASYSAARSGDLDRFGDLPAYLRGLLAELPPQRAHLGPWLVLWIAETLAQDTCAFDAKKRDTSRAPDAARVLDVALEGPGEAVMWAAAVRYRGWTGDREGALATARRGLAAFANDRAIATAALEAITPPRKGKKKTQEAPSKQDRELARPFEEALERAKELDPDAFTAATVALANKKKFVELFDRFLAYVAAGGQLAPGPVCNGLFPLLNDNGVKPTPAFAAETFPRIIQAALASPAFRMHDVAIVQVGTVLDLMPEHRPLFLRLGMPHLAEPGAGLHAQLLWHAYAAKDQAAVDRVMTRLDEALAKNPEHVDAQSYTLENLAEFAVDRGEPDRALRYLTRLKAADPKRFETTREGDALKALRESAAAQGLYGKSKKPKA